MTRYYSPQDIANETGFSAGFIRDACKRGKAYHPLPHIKVGTKRPHVLITLDDFDKWLDEEKVYQLEG